MEFLEFIEKILNGLFKKEQIKSFEDKLFLNNNIINSLKKYIYFSIFSGALIGVGGMLTGFYLGLHWEKFIILGMLISLIPFFVIYLIEDLIFEKNKRKKEMLLPELLLETSIFCDSNSLLKTIEKISLIDSFLAKDFKRALIEHTNGSSLVEGLERIKELNKSKHYSRIIDLFITGYNTGANMSLVLRETAEDLMENQAIVKERQAVMLVTKYTLLLSAGLIVPAIMGLIIGLVSGMNFNMSELGIGMKMEVREELFSFAVMGVSTYIIEYSFIGSLFLALQEGNKKNFWAYIVLILPASLIIFFLTQTF